MSSEASQHLSPVEVQDSQHEREIIQCHYERAVSDWLGALSAHLEDPSDEKLSLAYYDAKMGSIAVVDIFLDQYLDLRDRDGS